MSHPNILVTDSDGIISIGISRRDKKNAITGDMYRAMSAALGRAREQNHVRVALIRGQSDLFTAGNDLGDFPRCQTGDPSAALPLPHQLAAFEKPLIATVAGDAVGIGTALLLHCDLVHAAARKLIAQPAQALAATKALMKRPPERGAIEAMDEEAICFSELVAAPAAREKVNAFLEKRAADPTAVRGSNA
jgi:enoyl-CoA hydratase/carnithine racemase